MYSLILLVGLLLMPVRAERLSVSRAIIPNPELLLVDEPFGSLTPQKLKGEVIMVIGDRLGAGKTSLGRLFDIADKVIVGLGKRDDSLTPLDRYIIRQGFAGLKRELLKRLGVTGSVEPGKGSTDKIGRADIAKKKAELEKVFKHLPKAPSDKDLMSSYHDLIPEK
ncbi:MAG: hypothetical protein AAF492_05150 [Verrucomicrobiota bacterium]